MKITLLLLLALAAAAPAQTNHTVTLAWTDTQNPSGTTYTVYRSTGLCSGTPTFSKLATGVPQKTYDDATVQPGNYCYQVTASYNSVESSPSNSALAPVPAWSPQQLSLTVK